MEKISHIVRGSARVASTDLKSSAPLRPGTPSFGRPVGESPSATQATPSTASRAAALQAELNEQRKPGGGDPVVQQMADQFFMSRVRGGEGESIVPGVPRSKTTESGAVRAQAEDSGGELESVFGDLKSDDSIEAPRRGYTPKGTFVDVRA
jgi:hypothetical protein